MTFVEYARARRMGLAMNQIRSGQAVIDAQLATGYESSSGFRDAFSKIMGAAPTLATGDYVLKAAWLDTRLGPMIVIANESSVLLLEFVDRQSQCRYLLMQELIFSFKWILQLIPKSSWKNL